MNKSRGKETKRGETRVKREEGRRGESWRKSK